MLQGKKQYFFGKKNCFSWFCLKFSLFHLSNFLFRNHFTSAHATTISSTSCAGMPISGSSAIADFISICDPEARPTLST